MIPQRVLNEIRNSEKKLERISLSDRIKKEKENIYPKEDLLDLRWTFNNKKQKLWYICCSKCGNIRLVKAKNGLRCHYNNCNTFHSYNTWNKLRLKLYKIASFGSDFVGKIEQQGKQKIDKDIF